MFSTAISQQILACEPASQPIPADAIRPGGRYEVQGCVYNSMCKTYLKVYVSQIYSPDRFFFQLIENQGRLSSLMSKMQEFYTLPYGDAYKITQDDLVVGLPIAATYKTSDGDLWHRGMISDIPKIPNNTVEVFYVDYGTKFIQPLENIRMIRRKFMVFYAQAIPARLANVRKPDDERLWSKQAIEAMLEFAADSPLICEVVGFEEHCFAVNICDTRQPNIDVYMGDMLVSKNLAAKSDTSGQSSMFTMSSQCYLTN